jgi:arginine N-succinyltransferase
MRYVVRSAGPEDQEGLLALAGHLDTVNLPDDPEEIRALLERTEKSFAGQIREPRRREYVFVVEDRAEKRLAGTSMVIAQYGRRDAPFISLEVKKEEKYSQTLDRHFEHTLLRLAFNYHGPTEIGGLIVLPEYRKVAERLGQLISYVRFLYIGMHRSDFQDEVVAELLPPLEPDGTSHLWEALGRHFTGMTYLEADKLSKKNKEFIRSLFPLGDIHAALLPEQAQAVIGAVGPQTKGVERMLRRIGFRYDNRVDPFDGGPHFRAKTDEITLISASAQSAVGGVGPVPEGAKFHIVLCERAAPPYLLGARTPAVRQRGGLLLPSEAADAIGVRAGDQVWSLPLD